ncbi:MAG: hypothetical protein JWN76_880 [Chitinophagaceae bacterium]|nr:hypothetical protein [Chitinophagaceae bacterium]
MQHIEFFDTSHFEDNYFRVPPPPSLSHFIDFIWETKFDHLWDQYPDGFSDALFPNTGYSYLLNLGTPFIMQVDDRCFDMKNDGFLPRNRAIECYHQKGNRIFGIKFRISPVIFEKKINFSEYKEYIFPLSYLLNQEIASQIKNASVFEERVAILSAHYQSIVDKYSGSLQPINIVTEILDHCNRTNDFITPIETYAERYKISLRTLQRYFEATTSMSSKKTIQVMRVRKAVQHIACSPATFDCSLYGYYDQSHFYKHLKQFVQKKTLENLKPHLQLLQRLHK